MAQLLVLHGPNLNLLGSREPEVYGRATLAEIDADLAKRAEGYGLALTAFQSNAEDALVERIQAARGDGTDFILINPAAFTHTSMKGIATAASASRIATEVWVKAAGLIRMKAVPSPLAAWMRSTRASSALDWKAVSASP